MESTLDEAVVRPVLKELTDNAVVSSPANNANAHNKIGSKKSEKFDVVGGINDNSGNKGDCTTIATTDTKTEENVNNTTEFRKYPTDNLETRITEEETDLTKTKERSEISSTSDTFNSTVLPDIVNVQPSVISTVSDTDDSLILALTGLQIGTPKGQQDTRTTLLAPNATLNRNSDALSAISSDDEVFSECQTYSEATAMSGDDLNQSIHWENVVSSVTTACVDSIDNTLEQIEPSTTDLVQVQSASGDGAKAASCEGIVTSNEAVIDSMIAGNLETDNKMVANIDTTCILDKTIDAECILPLSNNEVNLGICTKTPDFDTTHVVADSTNSDSIQLLVPELKVDEVKTPPASPDVTTSCNATFNSEDSQVREKSMTPSKDLNTTFPTTPSSMNATVDSKHNSPVLTETTFINTGNVSGTIGTSVNTSLNNDLVAKIEQEKCKEKELKAEMASSSVPEPMEVDDVASPAQKSMGIMDKTTILDSDVRSTQEGIETLTKDQFDMTFKMPKEPAPQTNNHQNQDKLMPGDEDFATNGFILNPSDFDFLLSKGSNAVTVERSSILLKFDPFVGHSVPVNQQQSNVVSSQEPVNCTVPVGGGDEFLIRPISTLDTVSETDTIDSLARSPPNFPETQKLLKERINRRQPEELKGNAKMSVDVIQDMKIENDTKSIEGLNSDADEKQDYKMAELEKKIKNDSLKTDDLEKKLKDAEQREEALLKRVAEKDRTISKMSGVLGEYEKAIAELIAAKEQIIQNYEKQMSEIKSDRDLNYQHLNSLEATFSDLHAKYERSKQVAATLKANEEALLEERKQNLENLRLQEQRYDKMKNHAMQQLEIANNKLETLSKNHAIETTKLKALLKKEEISRLSVNEQLQQKARENEELVKICDELINGQGSS